MRILNLRQLFSISKCDIRQINSIKEREIIKKLKDENQIYYNVYYHRIILIKLWLCTFMCK